MIELNLLPDVKMEYLKAERSRRLVASVSVIVILASVGLLVMLLLFAGAQAKHLSDLNADIKKDSQTLKDQPGIEKVLTVQNQLESLTELHSKKPAVSRMFEFLNQVTPTGVSITNLLVDFNKQEITITGTADSLGSVNKYVDTLKYTKYTVKDGDGSDKAFENVVMSSFGISASSDKGQPATYSISLKYKPDIFDITKEVKLSVPAVTTTRSAISSPTELFQPEPTTPNRSNQ